MIDFKLSGYHCAASSVLDSAIPLNQKAGPGHWNNLDTLEVGNCGMTYDEYVIDFSKWVAVKSPLILGNDATAMSAETLEIVTNKAVIAESQDARGSPANRIWEKAVTDGDIQLWSPAARKASYRLYDLWAQKTTQPPSWDSVASQFPSFSNSSGTSNCTLKTILARSTNWGKDIGIFQGSVKGVTVPAHGVKLWRAKLATPITTSSASFHYEVDYEVGCEYLIGDAPLRTIKFKTGAW
ncbi:hypothetical protein FRC07_010658, partial [Ceratobasidium sp. 392]